MEDLYNINNGVLSTSH